MDFANILTIDVEDWFHILESDDAPNRADWTALESRVEANTGALLEILDRSGARATFFVVGWVARQVPGLARRIADAGHELASHSYWHEVVRRHDVASFAADVAASKKLLEDQSGQPVEGFRAPGSSITPAEAWAFEVLLEQGYTYDSSLCPGASSHGGFRSGLFGPHLISCRAGELVEIPSSTLGVGSFRTPYAGGGYLRLFPYALLRMAVGIDNGMGRPANVYVHPREIDPGQPRMDLPLGRRFKYYVGLQGLSRKLEKLLARHRFVGARQWIRENRPELLGQVLDLRERVPARPSPDPARVPPLPC